MSEDLEMTPGGTGLDRRDFIRRSAILGGMVWAVPVIHSVPAFALSVGTAEDDENGGDKRTISYVAFALYNDGSGIFKFEAEKDGVVPSSLDSAPKGCGERYIDEGLTVGTGGDLDNVTLTRPDLFYWTITPTASYGVAWVLVKGGNGSGDDGTQCTYIPGGEFIYPKGTPVTVSTYATSNPAPE